MVGQGAAHWSPYDFTPVTLPSNRKRQRSEVPHARQPSGETYLDTETRRQPRTFHNHATDATEVEQTIHPHPTSQRPRREGQPHLINVARSFTPGINRTRGTSSVPGIGDFLGSFKQPEAQPVFKEEPLDDDIMSLPLRSAPSTRKRKNEKARAGAPRSDIPPLAPTRQRQPSRNVNEGPGPNDGDASIDGEVGRLDTVVDLTGDDEERSSLIHANAKLTIHPHGMPYSEVSTQHTPNDNERIPDNALQQIKEQYRREKITIPTNITEWQQLEEFVGTNSKPSLVTPSLVSRFRAICSSNDKYQQHFLSFLPQSSAFTHDAAYGRPNRNHSLYQNEDSFLNSQAITSRSSAHGPTANSGLASDSVTKHGPRVQTLSSLGADNPLHQPADSHSAPITRSRSRNTNDTQAASSTLHPHEPIRSTSHSIRGPSPAVINSLMHPSEALPNLLPSSAPLGHPHLVSVWNADLLKLSREQHNHLDLIDTVVSIICRYDMKEQSAIKAFFDTNAVQHFFFLFKSRTSAWHSWSVEREWDIVTIGLERNNRASNTAESQRPSSGQFDVTVQYRMDPPMPIPTSTAPVNSADADQQVTTTIKLPPSTQTLPPTNNIPAAQPSPTDNSPPHPTIPGRWHLHSTTIFPSQPSLQHFLWSTPPNRGADEVSRYHHPTQTPYLPPSHLTMLARYLQHTAFTCTAIEAEFQVAWGRKVRYDSVLGRVRATWEYALKGAKTQAEKRKRGEYNVNVGAAGRGGEKNGAGSETGTGTRGTAKKGGREERPGAGEAMEWLAGHDATTATHGGEMERRRTSIDQEASGNGNVVARTQNGERENDGLNGFTVNNSNTNTVKNEDERPTKRPKREHGRASASGSEYTDSSDEE